MENQILQQILSELKDVKGELKDIKGELKDINLRLDNLEIDVKSIKDQTVDLTEFKTFASEKLDKMSYDIDFIKHEGFETKQDLFAIKHNLKSIK